MANSVIQRMGIKIPGKGVLHQLEGKHLSLKLQKRIAFQTTMRGNKLLKGIKRENLEAWKKKPSNKTRRAICTGINE